MEDTVTVGSKDFTEQFVMAETMAQPIKGRTDLAVRRRTNLGGTMVCHSALTRNYIDLYVEYTGTALVSILRREEALREAFAQEHDLETISDVAAIADRLDAGFTAEFSERGDGYAGLKRTYDIELQSTRDMDPSLMSRP